MAERDQRLDDALRLKAARMLAGKRGPMKKNGTQQAIAMSTDELAAFPALVDNRVTVNRLEQIEQMRVDARPWELDLIAQVLDLPSGWFSRSNLNRAVDDLLRGVAEAVQEPRREPAAADSTSPASGRRPRASKGAAS